MQGRKRSRFLFVPPSDSNAPGDSSVPDCVAPASKEQQDLEHEFLHKYLKLADIALSTPPKSKRKKIA